MKKQDFYYIMAFDTTTDAMQAEAYAKDRIPSTIMPVPREISSGCGLALRFMETDEQSILTFCNKTDQWPSSHQKDPAYRVIT